MAIYSEDQDPNEVVKSSKDLIIEKIKEILKEYGSFTIADVEADHSPSLETKGKLVHLGEEFEHGNAIIYVYDPTSHSSDEIDKYDAFYSEFKEEQLEYILELAEKWVEMSTYFYDVHVELPKGGYSVGIKDTEEWEDFEEYGVDIKKVAPHLEEPNDVYLIDSVESISEEEYKERFNK